jgi:uncharacterized protein involved in type VI secretion and phage assembly
MNEDSNNQAFFGKYRGVVTDNQDPQMCGRIKAKVPDVFGDDESGWATPCAPFGGLNTGFFAMPKVNAGVWIEFEQGDPDYPIWSGCWWSEQEAPKNELGVSGMAQLKILRSEEGLMVTLDDSSQTLTLSDEHGRNILMIQAQQGLVTIQGAVKVVVEAPQIELVKNATHPIVFGDQLLQYLNQLVTMFNVHVHPGEMALGVFPVTPAPPVPLLQPATPALLSIQVKSG